VGIGVVGTQENGATGLYPTAPTIRIPDTRVVIATAPVDAKGCAICGKPIGSPRADAQYCSAACKQKHYRRVVADAGGGTATSTDAVAALVGPLDDETREWFEERAAIMEFDGGLARVTAERMAMAEVHLNRGRRA
jgi:hypothetical protein